MNYTNKNKSIPKSKLIIEFLKINRDKRYHSI